MQEGGEGRGGMRSLCAPSTRLLMAVAGMCILPLSCARRIAHVHGGSLVAPWPQAGFGSMHGRLRHPFLTSGGRYIFQATK